MNRLCYLRSDLYSALAAAFGPPGRELLAPSDDNELLRLLPRAAEELPLPSLEPEVAELSQLLTQAASQGEDAKTRLEGEYQRLFGGWGGALVHPYESVYRGDGGRLMGKWAAAVQLRYAEDGLVLQCQELPDHLAVELEYLAFLCFKEARAWEELGMEAALEYGMRQRSFIREHLSQWVPAFCRSLLASANHPFYLCLATVLRELLAWEERQLVGPESRADLPAEVWLIEVDGARCSLCEACVALCPVGALRLEQNLAEERLVRTGVACNGCGECVKRCPDLAMKLKGPLSSEEEGAEAALVRSPMICCLDCGQPMGSEAVIRRAAALLEAKGETSWLGRSGRCPRCEMKGALTATLSKKSKEAVA